MPHQNKKDLMLRQDVVKAVKDGKFHIYTIKTIDEGIEILTGMKAGKRLKSGEFEKDTVHYLANKTLAEYARHWRELIS
jgi:ATP-dependent Lon protease